MKLDRLLENQCTIIALLRRQNVAHDVPSGVVDDILKEPMERTEEMEELCRKLEDDSFKSALVCVIFFKNNFAHPHASQHNIVS